MATTEERKVDYTVALVERRESAEDELLRMGLEEFIETVNSIRFVEGYIEGVQVA